MAARIASVPLFAARRATCAAVRRAAPFLQHKAATPARMFSARAALFEKKYTEDHEWVEISSDGKTATLGISKYAANALGDVVYVEIPETGLELEAGDSLGAIESVKSASDILTPFGGTVLEANEALADKPGTVNNDPEGEGWIAKLEIKGEPEGKLMNAEEYLAFTEEATEA